MTLDLKAAQETKKIKYMGSYGMLQYLLPFSISVCTYLSLSIFSPMFCTLLTSVLYCSLHYSVCISDLYSCNCILFQTCCHYLLKYGFQVKYIWVKTHIFSLLLAHILYNICGSKYVQLCTLYTILLGQSCIRLKILNTS